MDFKRTTYALSSYSEGCLAWQKEETQKYFKPTVIFFPILLRRNLFLHESQFKNHESYIQYKKFIASIPAEIRKLVRPLGKYQWLSLEALCHIEHFDDFLKQETDNNSLQYIVAAWTLAMACNQPFSRRLALVRDVMYTERSKVIASLLDLPSKKSLLKLFNQFSIDDMDPEFISILYHFSKEKKLYTALQKNPKTRKVIVSKMYYELPDWLITPLIVKALNSSPDYINSLRGIFPPLIREAEGTQRQQILASLKSVKDYRSLEVKLAELSQDFLLAGDFPAPPFKGSKKLAAIETGADLKKEGLAMHNCVAGYVEEILRGESCFYHWDDGSGEAATVQLTQDSDNFWYFEEALGFDNTELQYGTLLKIKNELARLMPQKELPILSGSVAGTCYYKAAHLWSSINTESQIVLRREPDNPYDPLAVAVFLSKDNELFQLGYIPRIYNDEIASLMDEGQGLLARVIYKEERGTYRHIGLQVSISGTEENAG